MLFYAILFFFVNLVTCTIWQHFFGQASFSSRELCAVDLNIKSPHEEWGDSEPCDLVANPTEIAARRMDWWEHVRRCRRRAQARPVKWPRTWLSRLWEQGRHSNFVSFVVSYQPGWRWQTQVPSLSVSALLLPPSIRYKAVDYPVVFGRGENKRIKLSS